MTPTETSHTREAQGLPHTISDPSTLAKIAALVALPMNGDVPKADKARRLRREAGNGGAK